MVLRNRGKYIDTTPLQHALSQEESQVDHVSIVLEKMCDQQNLEGFAFVMRGITESGAEMQAQLEQYSTEGFIYLTWHVDRAFTMEAGMLALDLFGYYYQEQNQDNPEDAENSPGIPDFTVRPPDRLIRFQMPPVQVRGLPESTHTQDADGFLSLVLQLQKSFPEIEEILAQLQNNDTAHDGTLTAHSERIQDLESQVKIQILTQEAYNELETPDEQVLYVIRG